MQVEAPAYGRLADLHGFSTPRFYGKVRIGTSRRDVWPSQWTLDLDTVDGIAIEFIDGVSADQLKRRVDLSEADAESVCQAALQIMRDITHRCVSHNDIASRNIVVRHSDLRPFLIDFGSARMPRADESLGEWKRGLWARTKLISSASHSRTQDSTFDLLRQSRTIPIHTSPAGPRPTVRLMAYPRISLPKAMCLWCETDRTMRSSRTRKGGSTNSSIYAGS